MNIFGSLFSGIGWFFGFFINRPLGYILGLCYHITKNYGLALLVFTLITRVLLFPLAVKQQKSTAEMMRLQPKTKELQKKYGKDKEKLNEEMMKLYQEEGYNPFGGCLPLLIQIPILYGLVNVIYRPLTYIIGLDSSQIKKIVETLWTQIVASAGGVYNKMTPASALNHNQIEIFAANAMKNNMDKLTFLPKNILHLDFSFFGLDLSATPGFKLSVMVIIPILCYISSFVSTWYSMKITQAANPSMGDSAINPAGMNKSMLIIMPLISTYFAFQVPTGVGFYWICTNLFMILQVFLLNVFFHPKKLAEKAEIESEKRKRARRMEMAAKQGIKSSDENQEKTADLTTDSDKSEQTEEKKENENNSPDIKKETDSSFDIKKSNKQKMEENRKRLSASRAKDKKKKK